MEEPSPMPPAEEPTQRASGDLIDPALPLYTGDDSYETTLVQRLAFDTPGSGTFTSLFEAHNWVFEAQEGQTVTITSTGVNDVDTRVTLIDPDGEVITVVDDTDAGVDPLITITLASSGLHTIRIDTWDEGAYTVLVTAGAAASGGSQWAVFAVASSEYGQTSWSAMQATGAPDVTMCGDDGRAWASLESDTQEWLQLTYQTPVVPTLINVVETYNPGHIYKIEAVGVSGTTYVVYEGDPQAVDECPRTSQFTVSGITEPVYGLTIYIDQTSLNSWAEIDAVELVGEP
jgi:hypothetical protein